MALKTFSGNVPAPEKLSLSGNIPDNWLLFKREFLNYHVASRLSNEVDTEYQTSVFLSIIGRDAFQIFDGLEFEEDEDKKDLNTVISKFEDFFLGQRHEAYESYKFHLRKQEINETIEMFVAELRRLSKSCNFADPNRTIRDQVVIGAYDDSLREKLLADKKLTLENCLIIGRAHESSRKQTKEISSTRNNESHINRVEKKNFETPKYKRPKKCTRCGKYPTHEPKDCPAIRHRCGRCSRYGHFDKFCYTKENIGVIEENYFLGSICTNAKQKNIDWHKEIKVTTKFCTKTIKFRLDTGADLIALPDKMFRKNSPIIRKTNKKLYGAGRNQLNVVGYVEATLKTERSSIKQDLYVVKDLIEPLLGGAAINALNLLPKIETIKRRNPQPKKEFPKVDKGQRKMEKAHTIQEVTEGNSQKIKSQSERTKEKRKENNIYKKESDPSKSTALKEIPLIQSGRPKPAGYTIYGKGGKHPPEKTFFK